MIVLVGANLLLSCDNAPKNQKINQRINVSAPAEVVVRDEHSDTIHEGLIRVNLDSLGFINDMVYATQNNFTHQQIYPCPECYLRDEVAQALVYANQQAQKQNLRIIIYDCYRPISLQQKMYDIVQNPDYVAHPKNGSKHNRGCAVDVGLADFDGKPLNMGTQFDDFSEKAHYANTRPNSQERKNRKILRDLMLEAKFLPYEKEWWHFNFNRTDFPTSNFQWNCN